MLAESGEAALRRLFASRAIGGLSLTSDDPAPGSLTVFQSSRVAGPQDASRALDLLSFITLLVSTWTRTSSVCLALFLKSLTWKPGCNWPVGTLTQSSSIADVTAWDAFVIWNKPAQLGLLTAVWNTLVSFFVVKKAGAQRFIIGARASNRHFF